MELEVILDRWPGRAMLRFEFDNRLQREIKRLGGGFDGASRCWWVDEEEADAVVRYAERLGYEVA